MNRYMNFAWHSHFTFVDATKIIRVLNVMENLSKSDEFFANALQDFQFATASEKIKMCKYLLWIFNSVKNNDAMTLEQAVILSAYE